MSLKNIDLENENGSFKEKGDQTSQEFVIN